MNDLRARIQAAAATRPTLATMAPHTRREVLQHLARALKDADTMAPVLTANDEDMRDGEAARAAGDLSAALVARLALTPQKLSTLADGLRTLASQPDRVGARLTHRRLADGLVLEQRRHPLGVIGVVFEARPDALPQIVGLALKSGNAIVLKGGKEAARTNAAMTAVIHAVLDAHKVPRAAVTLLADRAAFQRFMEQDDLVDLLIARGSGAFVSLVQQATKIPVLGHAEGLCHVYVHADAAPHMAAAIVLDAKTSYPAACNAVETVLWHRDAGAAVDTLLDALLGASVEVRGCPETLKRRDAVTPATDEDWDAEYSDLIVAVRRVDALEDALDHIADHGSRHTEAIVCEDEAVATRFIDGVDAACIFHNASTRFADGLRFGLGGEVGISTGKLHARGPVGVEGLMTTRWILRGAGDTTASFADGTRQFTHEDL